MRAGIRATFALVVGLCGAVSAQQFDWQQGPTVGPLGDQAEVDVPEEYVYLGASDTRALLEFMENPLSGRELGTLAPASDEESWLVFFEFDETGYVKDDDRELDADALLDARREGNEAGNEERKRRGWATLDLVGWQIPPRYDPETQNLEWALLLTSEGRPVVNHNTRLLGRHGVMEVSLVCGPDELDGLLPRFRELLAGFRYTDGNKYSEFTSGDKIAKYGLAGLIAGGGVAAAVKTGLFKKFGRWIVIGVIAVGAAVKKFFTRK